MRITTRNWMLAALVGISALYIAWPYWSAHQLRQAFESGDVAALNRRVAWPALRASIKEMLAAEMMREMTKKGLGTTDGEKLGAGLAAVLGPAMVDRMVDSFVTPHGLVGLVSRQAGGSTNVKIRDDMIRRASLVSPTRFEIELGQEGATRSRMLGVMELTDFDWKLTQLIVLGPMDRL